MKVAGIGSMVKLSGKNYSVIAITPDKVKLKPNKTKKGSSGEVELSFHDFESLLDKKKLVVLDTKRE